MREIDQFEGSIIVGDFEREGWEPFEIRRAEMVTTFDRVLSLIATVAKHRPAPLWLNFQLISFADYLAIHPEKVKELRQHQADGILDPGIWFTAPNLNIVSAEAIVRNLLLGRGEIQRLGLAHDCRHALVVGGTFPQLAQILRGFGLDTMLSLSSASSGPRTWSSRDGSKIVETKFRTPPSSDMSYLVDYAGMTSDQDPPSLVQGWIIESLRQYVDRMTMEKTSLREHRQIKQDRHPERAIHGLLDSIHASSSEEVELRTDRFNEYSPATRVDLRHLDFIANTQLRLWSEPLVVWVAATEPLDAPTSFASANVGNYRALINHAWRLVLQNHTPAVIGGHGSDIVSFEARARYSRALQLADWTTQRILQEITSRINTRRLRSRAEGYVVTVFNPSDSPRSEVVEPTRDQSGLPRGVRSNDDDGYGPEPIRFLATDVPPRGYKVFQVDEEAITAASGTTDNGNIIENEFVTVQLDQHSGTLSIFDKQTGRRFDGLGQFVDGGDEGDSYCYLPPTKDTLISIATNTPIFVERTVSAVDQRLSFLQIYRIPGGLTSDRMSRLPLAAQFVPLSIATSVYITHGSNRVDIESSVTTSARDHRVRVLFPIGSEVDKVFVDSHFDVLTFENGADYGGGLVYRGFQEAFTTVLGSDSGFTIANRGIREVEVSQLGDSFGLILTLFRSISQAASGDGASGLRSGTISSGDSYFHHDSEYRFSYALIPHGRDTADAWETARAYQTDLRAIVTNSTATGPMPLTASFLSAEPAEFVISTVKMAMDRNGYIIRGYNCGSDELTVRLHLGFEAKRVRLVNLDESNSSSRQIKLNGAEITFRANPGQVVSLLVET